MDYCFEELAPEHLVMNGYDLTDRRYNIASTTRIEIIRPTEGGLSVDYLRQVVLNSDRAGLG